MNQLSLVACNGYSEKELEPALRKGLEPFENFLLTLKGKRVFLKINHLMPADPEKAVITDPRFTSVAVKILLEYGTSILIGDDVSSLDHFKTTGYLKVAEKYGVEISNLRSKGFSRQAVPDGRLVKEIFLAKEALEADVLINLPKFKTHSFTLLTGALKNIYGLIPQGKRTKYHRDYQDVDDFSQGLVDIYSTLIPSLNIMDAVVGMEGDGPAGGSPRKIGAVIIGTDALAVDALVCRMVNLNPESLPTNRLAAEQGGGIIDLDRINIFGDDWQRLVVKDFQFPSTSVEWIRQVIPGPLYRLLRDQLDEFDLTVAEDKCTHCLDCKKSCPVGAITPGEKVISINRELCIECFCCQEMCSYQAIVFKRKPLAKFITKTAELVRKVV